MQRISLGLLLIFSALNIPGLANAETIVVKYRGTVDLKPFTCESVSRSSFVQRVCYDRSEQYMLINLKGTYYHYCEIDSRTVDNLLNSQSMGRYYNAEIKVNFDCRSKRIPSYR